MLRLAVCRRGIALALLAVAAPLPTLGAQAKGKKVESVPARPRFTVARDSNSASSYYYHGLSVLGNRPREAADAFYWAMRLDPEWAAPMYARRIAFYLADRRQLIDMMSQGRTDKRSAAVKAIDSLQYAATLRDPFLHRALDRMLLEALFDEFARRSRPDAMVPTAGAILSNGSLDIRAWYAYTLGQMGSAIDLYAQALKKNPKLIDARIMRAHAFYHDAQFDSARAELAVALDSLRKRDETKLSHQYDSKAFLEYAIGRIHSRQGDIEGARAAYGRALSEDLSFFMAHAALGDIAIAQHDTATALGEYELVIQLEGDDAALRYQYGALLFNAAKYDAAAEQFRKAIELDPDYVKPYFPLAYVRDGMGADAEAIALYDGYVRRAPASDGPRIEQARTRLAELRASAQQVGSK